MSFAVRTALVGVSSVLLLAGCKEEQRNAYVAPPPPAVTVAPPVAKTVTDYVELTGTTAAVASVQLVARVPGYLQQIHFEDGARVNKGDLLFTIQQDQYQAELDQAQAGAVGAVLVLLGPAAFDQGLQAAMRRAARQRELARDVGQPARLASSIWRAWTHTGMSGWRCCSRAKASSR